MKFEKISSELFSSFEKSSLSNTDQIIGGGIETDSKGLGGSDCIDDTCCSDGTTGNDIYVGTCC